MPRFNDKIPASRCATTVAEVKLLKKLTCVEKFSGCPSNCEHQGVFKQMTRQQRRDRGGKDICLILWLRLGCGGGPKSATHRNLV